MKVLPIESVLSYSRIDCFKQCQMKYKLKYVDKNYSETTSLALQLGTLSHYIFELKFDPNRTMTLDEIWQGFIDGFVTEDGDHITGWDELCFIYGFDIYEIDSKTGNSVEDRVEIMKHKFFNEPIEEEWEVVGLEQEFLITFNNKAQIKGFIDRVDRHKITGELRVVDLKTNKKPYEQKDLTTALQMYIYALACKELYGQYPSECVYDLLFLDMKQKALTKGWEQRGFKALNKILDQLILFNEIGSHHMKPNSCPLCFWCDYSKTNPNADKNYNNLCEYYSLWKPNKKTFAVNKKWTQPALTTGDDITWD